MDKFPSRERATAVAVEPRVSAVMVVRGVGAHKAEQSQLDLSLRSILAEPWIDDVVLVDNGNAPEVSSSLRALQADRRDVQLVGAPIGAGAAAAANLGAAQAMGRWLLFVSPDVVLQRGGVQRMAASGAQATGPWIVGGRLTDTAGREQRAAHMSALNSFSTLAMAVDLPQAKAKRRKRKASTPVGAVSSSLMLVPRADFQSLGGFDAGFMTDCADLDLCRRAKDEGGSVLLRADASGVRFRRHHSRGREAQGLALFAAKSAKTPIERAFAVVARPALATLLWLREFVAGRPPGPR